MGLQGYLRVADGDLDQDGVTVGSKALTSARNSVSYLNPGNL